MQEVAIINKKLDKIKSESLCLNATVYAFKQQLKDTEFYLNNSDQYLKRECIKIMVYYKEESIDNIVVDLAKKIDVSITIKDVSISHQFLSIGINKIIHAIIANAKYLSRKIRNQVFGNQYKLKSRQSASSNK